MSTRTRLMFAVAAAAGLSAYSNARAVVPTVDGSYDATYGSASSVQTVNTQFGDNSSELDAAYTHIEGGKLYLFISGNLESNYNHMMIFFDTRAGGQNTVLGNNPDVDFNALSGHYTGMKFDTAFSPDYALWFARDTGNSYVNFSEMNTGGGGFGAFLGQVAMTGGVGAGTVGGSGGAPAVGFGYNDANLAGVGSGTGAADGTAAQAVTTGAEFSIDLASLGITSNFKVMIGVNGSGHDFWSNQFLGGLTPPQDNLGSDGAGGVTTADFSLLDGNQYFTVNYSAPTGHWNNPGSGSWSNSANWQSAVVPNSTDARAYLDSTAGSAARTVTLDVDVQLSYLNFDSAGGYTIQSTGGHTLTIAGNPASPAIDVTSGNHTINAPLILAATTNIGVATGSSLNMTGPVTSAGITIVKSGGGLATLPRLNNTQSVFMSGGTLRIAANGLPGNVSKMGNLAFDGGYAAPTATLDVVDNDLILTNNAYSDIAAAVAHARDGNHWDATGLNASAAATDGDHNKSLGVVVGTEYHAVRPGAQFDGNDVADTDLLVKYTYYGDSDLSGAVDGGDYSHIDTTFNTEHTAGNIAGWVNGDFNYDGQVDGADYGLIDGAFNSQKGTLGRAMQLINGGDPTSSDYQNGALAMVIQHLDEFGQTYATAFTSTVPEPTAAGLALLGGVKMLMGRRRRRA